VLVGFAQVEKPLAKFSNQVIGRVCGFLNSGKGCGGEVLSMDVEDMVQELAVAFEFFFSFMGLNIPQVLLADIFCLGGREGIGLNWDIGHILVCLGGMISGKEGV
jgi:hypothetical protein